MNDVKTEIDAMSAEAERLKKMYEAYPDLKKYEGRWGKIAYHAQSVNVKVTDYDRRFNCGCCPDSPLEIWPYLETPMGKVYSSPPSFMVGDRYDHGCEVIPYGAWDSDMKKAGIPDALIERVRQIFKVEENEDGSDSNTY